MLNFLSVIIGNCTEGRISLYNVFKKKKIALENMKKTPSKVAHNRPKIIFFSTGLAAQMAQKQKSRTTKSPLMQDWVFRLGLH